MVINAPAFHRGESIRRINREEWHNAARCDGITRLSGKTKNTSAGPCCNDRMCATSSGVRWWTPSTGGSRRGRNGLAILAGMSKEKQKLCKAAIGLARARASERVPNRSRKHSQHLRHCTHSLRRKYSDRQEDRFEKCPPRRRA